MVLFQKIVSREPQILFDFFLFSYVFFIFQDPSNPKKILLLKIDYNETKMMLNFLAILNPSDEKKSEFVSRQISMDCHRELLHL